MRIAVNSGEAFVGAGSRREPFVTGQVITVAERLQTAAAPGEILLGDLTRRLTEGLVETEPLMTAVPAWRLLGLQPGADAQRQISATPFVGRSEELNGLRSALQGATRDAECHLVTLLGAPGIGKSRLVREVVATSAAVATTVVGRCPPYGEGSSFSPLAEIVEQLAGSDPELRLVEILGGGEQGAAIAHTTLAAIGRPGEPVNPEETAWAVRRLFEQVARTRPLIVVFDDVHWAGPTLLDLIEHVAAFSSGVPILIVCIARPDLLESRPSWAVPQPRRSQLVLEGLPDAHARRLVGASGLESQVAEPDRRHGRRQPVVPRAARSGPGRAGGGDAAADAADRARGAHRPP